MTIVLIARLCAILLLVVGMAGCQGGDDSASQPPAEPNFPNLAPIHGGFRAQLSPEDAARLTANTTLTPEQLSALERGTLVLPASQMEYLHELSRSLGGKGPAEIRAVMDKLGPNGGRVADALQLISNENVSTIGVDPGLKPDDVANVPARGGIQNLPTGIRSTFEALLRGPTVPTPGVNELGNPTIELPDPYNPFPHLGDYRDVAAIVSAGDPALQQGTALDAALLGKSQQILHDMHDATDIAWKENVGLSQQLIDPAVQDMLSAAGRDPIAVHDALAGADGRTPNSGFIEDLFTHQWADDGAAAGSLLLGTGAAPTDSTDPTQLAHATRAGETVYAVDQWVGENAPKLLDIAGTGNQSLGQVNPELTLALAEANEPLIDDMLGNPLDISRGFTTVESEANPEMPVTRDLFAVIDTDRDAATVLNSRAYLNGLQYQSNFEQSIIDGATVNVPDLRSAGTLRGMIDSAAGIADNDAIAYGNLQDVKAIESRGYWFDVAKTVGEEVPGVKPILDLNGQMPGDQLREIFIGISPTPDNPTYVPYQSSESLQHAIALRLLDNRIGDAGYFAELNLIDRDTGTLKPLDDGHFSDFRTALTNYFIRIDPAVKTGIEEYEDAYRAALNRPPGQPGR